MENIELSRKNFIKGLGLASIATLTGFGLSGCEEEGNTEKKYEDVAFASENTEYSDWTKTGNKEIKKAYEHMIYEIVPFKWLANTGEIQDQYRGRADFSSNNGEVIIPDGYAYVGSEDMISAVYCCTFAVKYNYINVVDVEVEEYRNLKTGEVCYPIAGTPLDLEKSQDAPKVLVR